MISKIKAIIILSHKLCIKSEVREGKLIAVFINIILMNIMNISLIFFLVINPFKIHNSLSFYFHITFWLSILFQYFDRFNTMNLTYNNLNIFPITNLQKIILRISYRYINILNIITIPITLYVVSKITHITFVSITVWLIYEYTCITLGEAFNILSRKISNNWILFFIGLIIQALFIISPMLSNKSYIINIPFLFVNILNSDILVLKLLLFLYSIGITYFNLILLSKPLRINKINRSINFKFINKFILDLPFMNKQLKNLILKDFLIIIRSKITIIFYPISFIILSCAITNGKLTLAVSVLSDIVFVIPIYLGINFFEQDQKGLVSLLLTPINRKLIIISKNLVMISICIIQLLFFYMILIILHKVNLFDVLFILLYVIPLMTIIASICNYLSIKFPYNAQNKRLIIKRKYSIYSIVIYMLLGTITTGIFACIIIISKMYIISTLVILPNVYFFSYIFYIKFLKSVDDKLKNREKEIIKCIIF